MIKKRRGNPNWTKGSCPNPGGRPKMPEEERALLEKGAKAGLETIIRLSQYARTEKVKYMAAKYLCDRQWGVPTQTIAGDSDAPITVKLVKY